MGGEWVVGLMMGGGGTCQITKNSRSTGWSSLLAKFIILSASSSLSICAPVFVFFLPVFKIKIKYKLPDPDDQYDLLDEIKDLARSYFQRKHRNITPPTTSTVMPTGTPGGATAAIVAQMPSPLAKIYVTGPTTRRWRWCTYTEWIQPHSRVCLWCSYWSHLHGFLV